jgi:hypothetical protein
MSSVVHFVEQDGRMLKVCHHIRLIQAELQQQVVIDNDRFEKAFIRDDVQPDARYLLIRRL